MNERFTRVDNNLHDYGARALGNVYVRDILITLIRHDYDQDGTVPVCQTTMAKYLNVSPSTIERGIRTLKQKGVVTCVTTHRFIARANKSFQQHDYLRKQNTYTINFVQLDALLKKAAEDETAPNVNKTAPPDDDEKPPCAEDSAYDEEILSETISSFEETGFKSGNSLNVLLHERYGIPLTEG